MKNVIPFFKFRYGYYMFSLIGIGILFGIAFFLNNGFKLGIDFQPGISMVMTVSNAPIDQVRATLADLPYSYTVQTSGGRESQDFVIRAPIPGSKEDLLQDMENKATQALSAKFGADQVKVLSVDYIGPSLSADLVVQTLTLILVVLLLMAVYITIRFRLGYAIGALLALIHDVLFTLGFIGAVGIELSTSVVAAILTLIGYSINDTIVVFDRIRENIRLKKDLKFSQIIDESITQSLSRTIVTSLTTLLVVIVLAVVTDGDIRSFSLTLLCGIIVGTYSSISIASQILPAFKSVRRDVASDQQTYIKAQAKV